MVNQATLNRSGTSRHNRRIATVAQKVKKTTPGPLSIGPGAADGSTLAGKATTIRGIQYRTAVPPRRPEPNPRGSHEAREGRIAVIVRRVHDDDRLAPRPALVPGADGHDASALGPLGAGGRHAAWAPAFGARSSSAHHTPVRDRRLMA